MNQSLDNTVRRDAVIALNSQPVLLEEISAIDVRVRATVCLTHSASTGRSRMEGRITPEDLRRLVELAKRGAEVVAS